MRWNGIVIGLFSLVALGILAAVVFRIFNLENLAEPHWGLAASIIGFIGGFLAGSWNTAHMRFDESPPQMPVSQALEFAKLVKDASESGDALLDDMNRKLDSKE